MNLTKRERDLLIAVLAFTRSEGMQSLSPHCGDNVSAIKTEEYTDLICRLNVEPVPPEGYTVYQDEEGQWVWKVELNSASHWPSRLEAIEDASTHYRSHA